MLKDGDYDFGGKEWRSATGYCGTEPFEIIIPRWTRHRLTHKLSRYSQAVPQIDALVIRKLWSSSG
jgi:hypothetical protein